MWDKKSKMLKKEIRLLKNLRQQLTQKIRKKAQIINNNRLVNNYSTRPVGEIKKSRKPGEKGSIALTQNQIYNAYIPTLYSEIRSQTTKK